MLKKTMGAAVGLVLVCGALPANAAVSASNAQFIAKLYTEGLGRGPDETGWRGNISFLASNVCNLTNMQTVANAVMTSQEFLTSAPTNQERAFRLYRAMLSRDASSAELTTLINALNGGLTWTQEVNNVLASPEFSNLVTSKYCSGKPSGWQAVQPANLVLTNTGAATTEAQLRAALQNAKAGSVVYIEQGATILLSDTLVVPAGVTVATVGQPGASKAPLLGRIARNASKFSGPPIRLLDNSALKSVWIDGQRNRFGNDPDRWPMVQAYGSNIDVSSSILSDTGGYSNLQYYADATSCSGGHVADNLITAYGSSHYATKLTDTTSLANWTDGISIVCSGVTVERNRVIDATDVAIVVYHNYPHVQTTVVQNNNILNAGNSAYGGLAADPLSHTNSPSVPLGSILDFTGMKFNDNVLWNSPAVHYDFVLADGTRPWMGGDGFTGKGATFFGNNSGSLSTTAFVGVGISGMLQTLVQSNSFTMAAPAAGQTSNCGSWGVVVAPAPYGNDAGSNLQPHLVLSSADPIVTGCIGHPAQ